MVEIVVWCTWCCTQARASCGDGVIVDARVKFVGEDSEGRSVCGKLVLIGEGVVTGGVADGAFRDVR